VNAPHVVVVGDAMLDRDVSGRVERLCPDAPAPVLDVTATRQSPGGAGLAALLCAASGARVTLLAPLADDDAGRALVDGLGRDVSVLPLGHEGATRTKTRVRAGGTSLARLDEGGPGRPTDVPVEEVAALLSGADAVLVSDYGAGTTAEPRLRALLAAAARRVPVVWDPHPRGAPPVEGVRLATPNVAEARAALLAEDDEHPDALALRLRHRWGVRAVVVTAGADGAYLATGDTAAGFVPAPVVPDGDPCGAGDRFAAAAAVTLARGSLPSAAVMEAVEAASAWVAAGGADGFRRRAADGLAASASVEAGSVPGPGTHPHPVPPPEARDPQDLVTLGERLRAGGRRLVATGGCFDLLHAGHVATLQAARRLGDALVVLLNSDASVRRLKGSGRPVVPDTDRARVLGALDCVDAVVVFEEDDPRAALALLRPDVWAKGGDYDADRLPEAEVVHAGGGRVVLLPYLDGHSTTGLLARAGAPVG